MSNNHQHAHSEHNHHSFKIESLNKIFVICIVLNLGFVFIEAIIGFVYNSLGLLSDAGHNLSDVFSLLLALVAFRLMKTKSTAKFTYGYKKSSILISLLNAIILLVAVGAIIVESIYKLKNPTPVNGNAVSITAAIGIIINGLTAWLLMKKQSTDINIRGAYLHMAADTLLSVGVLVSGIIITYTNWFYIDPIISIIIAIIILISTWRLLSESLRLSLDGVPKNINKDNVVSVILENSNVIDVHHLHIWAISTTENALTAHIIISDIEQMIDTKHCLKQRLNDLGISHATLEFELKKENCED